MVESTSSRLVFRQQYSTSDIQRQVISTKRMAPLFIFIAIIFVFIIGMNLSVSISFREPVSMLPLFPFILVFISLGVLVAMQSRLFGMRWEVTTTLDKDRGTVELDALRLSKTGEVKQSMFNRHKQYPLVPGAMFSVEPVIVSRRRYQTNTLFGLRLFCSSWLPVFVFQSTNVEIVTDLKRLVDGFVQGGSAYETAFAGDITPVQPEAGSGPLFRRAEAPLDANRARCPFCDASTDPSDSFCPRCGARLRDPPV